jgi:Helicase conserved C-terminal domain
VPSPPPRSLADELRRWDDDALATLLEQRPDLTAPVPTDLGSLAVAAASRLSVQRAVDGLDAGALQVLEVLAVLPEPVSAGEVARRWGASVSAPLAVLRGLALVWGGTRSLRLVRAARDSLGPYPAGLGPPLADALGRRSPQRLADVMEDLGLPPAGDPEVALRQLAAHLGDPDTVHRLLETAPAQARQVLDRLVWGPPVGQVGDADRPVRAGNAGSPVEWLLAHGLLAVADAGHVVLPREIGLALRGGKVHRRPELMPPALSLRERPTRQVEGSAAQAAAEAVRLVEELCELWGATPLSVLRAGGIGVRDLRRLSSTLGVDEPTAALVAEVAFSAGLVADDSEADPNWLPTAQYDLWRAGGTGERWTQLATGWLASSRVPGLVGSRGPKEGLIAALGPELERPQARVVRQQALTELAEASPPPGKNAVSSALADPLGSGLLARLDWSAPRRSGAARAELLRWALQEATWLGFTGLGALSSFGRRLVTTPDAPEAAAALLDAALPAPVDHVLLQADLTAVAPGQLLPDLEQELSLMADVESRGGAGVFRFTAASIRRALDAGRTGDELVAWLTANSRTPVPQPLAYLIADSARRYGRLRVGVAGSYLRADDESVLAEVLADRRAASLRLRRLAPTVLAAQATPDTVLAVLRSIGLAPAAESPDGELLIRKTPARRASGVRPLAPRRLAPPTASRPSLLTAIQGMRAIDANTRRPVPVDDDDAPALVPMDPAGALAVLRDALAARQDVWIGYLEEAGRPVRHIVEPLAVEAGRIRALERQTGRIRSYSVHRVIAVAPVTPADGSGPRTDGSNGAPIVIPVAGNAG